MSQTTTLPVPTAFMIQATDGYQACLQACTGWQQELARFADQRMVENRRAWEAFASSRDLAGMIKVQQDWALRATADYTQEATRLTELLTQSLTGTTPAIEKSATLVA